MLKAVSTMIREIELKYRLPDKAAFERLKSAMEKPISTVTQVNSFFDTPDLALRAKYLAIRVRKAGLKTLLTIKAKPAKNSEPKDVSIRYEYEREVSAKQAKIPLTSLRRFRKDTSREQSKTREFLLTQINNILDGRSVSKVGSFSNRRTSIPLQVGKYSLTAELDETDFGTGEIDYEIELELPENLIDEGRKTLEKLFKIGEIEATPAKGKAERFFKLLTAARLTK
jgi:uncharacterized protein YjbK